MGHNNTEDEVEMTATNKRPVISSTQKYRLGIRAPQQRQRPRNTKYERSGNKSNQRNEAVHDRQCEPPAKDFPV